MNKGNRMQRKVKRPTPQRKKSEKKPSFLKGVFPWLILFLIMLVLFRVESARRTQVMTISYSEFRNYIEDDRIEKVTFIDKDIRGTFKTSVFLPADRQGKEELEFRTFRTTIPFEDTELVERLYEKNILVESRSGAGIWNAIWPFLPFVGIVVIWILLLRQMQQGPKGVLSFGKSRAKLTSKDVPKVSFDDVAGVEEAKEDLKEVIEFLKSPQKFQKLGAKIPKGILLLGPPGTGKTLLARAVSGEAKVPFFSMSGSDFVELFVGVGASRVRDLFEKGKKNAPCIVFIDELDAVGRHRGAGIGGGHDEREQTLNALLVEMDGFTANQGVILIAATNRPDVLDPALLRPGRFDRQIIVDRPDIRGREGIFKVHTKKMPLAKDVKPDVIARIIPGFSGADIANMINEASLLAAKKKKKRVEMVDFESARDKILMGAERKSLIISEQEKKGIAYHESGHVLVAKNMKEADPIHKVTIIPRGMSLGVTQPLPVDERRNFSKEYCISQLTTLLGGRAAEVIALSTITTGAQNDIEQATALARKMVCEWGMSEKMGPISFGKKEEEIFLGREIAKHRDYSEETAKAIDKEVKILVEEAQKGAKRIIRDNIDNLHKIAKRLLEKEVLTGEEIDKIIKSE